MQQQGEAEELIQEPAIHQTEAEFISPLHTPQHNTGNPSSLLVTTELPTQEQVDHFLTWWNQQTGDDPHTNSLHHCLAQDLAQIGRQVNVPPYKFIPAYMKHCCQLHLWDTSKATAMCFFLAVHIHNPHYTFPQIQLPALNIDQPFPAFRSLPPQMAEATSAHHTRTTSAETVSPPTYQQHPPPQQKDFQMGTTTQTTHQQKVFDHFVQSMQHLVPPTTPNTQPLLNPPPTSPTPSTTIIQNGIQWDQATNSYSKNNMLLKYNRFSYVQSHKPELKWYPDIDLSTLAPPNHSLSNSHAAQYHNYQTFLQHLHFDLQYPEDQCFPVHYNPKYIQPQGIAGIPAVILQCELYIKEQLVADRYCQLNPSTTLVQANVDLAKSLRHETPDQWHLSLTKLFQHTDSQVKLRGNTTRLAFPTKSTPQLDKPTQKALDQIAPQIQRQPLSNQQPNIPTPQYNPTYTQSNSNYKGKNYDPHYKPPWRNQTQTKSNNYHSNTPYPQQGGGSNQGRR